MSNFVFSNPLVLSGSTGFESSLVGETRAVLPTTVEFSIGQGVGTTDNVTFNDVTGSNSITLVSGSESLTLGYQSISGSSGVSIDGEQFTISGSLTTLNDVTINGKITAQKIEAALSQSITIESSGSTKFGDDSNDKHTITGSLSMTGSFSLNGYTINEISNDASANDARTDSLVTEYAGKTAFAGTATNSGYLRKQFAKVASSITSTTASFTAVTSSAPSALTSTNENDFMFFNNGMIMEHDALKIMQKGSSLELHIDNSSLGYSLEGDDEVVAWGKFNS